MHKREVAPFIQIILIKISSELIDAMINMENRKIHYEATSTTTDPGDAVASAQTAQGCRNVLRTREDLGNGDSREEALRKKTGLRKEGAHLAEN
jgi:hypothetical protein